MKAPEAEEREQHFVGLRFNGKQVAEFELHGLTWEQSYEIRQKLDELDWLHVDFVVLP